MARGLRFVWPNPNYAVVGDSAFSYHRQRADLRQKGGAGNGPKGGLVRRVYDNGAEAGKGWRKRGRVPVYWPGKKARRGGCFGG